MPSVNIFVSFEFGKDNDLKNAFYTQAEEQSQHTLRNYSLNEAYMENVWKGKAREAIKKCVIVFVLVGQDTHNARGVSRGNRHSEKSEEADCPDTAQEVAPLQL